jgi:hypothetical protein
MNSAKPPTHQADKWEMGTFLIIYKKYCKTPVFSLVACSAYFILDIAPAPEGGLG